MLLTSLTVFDIFAEQADPNGVVAARNGSICVRFDAGGQAIYQNIGGGTVWRQQGPNGSGTWVLPANAPSALKLGSAADPDMMQFDTTAGAEVVIVGSTLGMRFNDLIPLRFGTPGTDLVFTPDGTDVSVTGTGRLNFADGVVVGWGTALADRFNLSSGGGGGSIAGTAVVAGGANAATRSLAISSGSRTKNDNNAGTPGSGPVSFTSGSTDVSFVGAAVGGDSGNVDVGSGAATSTGAGATSGKTGRLLLFTANSDDDNSGNIVIQTGTSPATRGILDLNVATIDTASQATSWVLANALAASLRIGSAGVPAMVNFDTGTNAVTFSENALTNLPVANRDTANNQIDAGFWLRATFPGGAVNTDVAVPARAGGYRVVDAYINNTSGGAGGGTLTVQTGAGVAITNAMVPGAADALTRAASVSTANGVIASGANIRLAGVGATTAGEAFVRVLPL